MVRAVLSDTFKMPGPPSRLPTTIDFHHFPAALRYMKRRHPEPHCNVNSGGTPSRQSHKRNASGRSRRRVTRTQPGILPRQGRLKTACCRSARGVANRWSDGLGELSGGASERPLGRDAGVFARSTHRRFLQRLKSHPLPPHGRVPEGRQRHLEAEARCRRGRCPRHATHRGARRIRQFLFGPDENTALARRRHPHAGPGR